MPVHDSRDAYRSDWLLHIGDDVRAMVHSLLVEAAGVVGRTPSEAWTRASLPSSVVVNRAISLGGRRRSASFGASNAMFTLVAPAYRVARRDRLEISGPPAPGVSSNHPGEAYAATVRWWIDELAQIPDEGRTRDARTFRLEVLRLTLGVIEKLGIDWRWFRVSPDIDGRHTIVVQPFEYGTRPKAFWSGRPEQPATMSPELAAEFNRLVDRRTHVSLSLDHSPGDLPWVTIGQPPEVAMARIERDEQPVELLRAIASVPPGARLLA